MMENDVMDAEGPHAPEVTRELRDGCRRFPALLKTLNPSTWSAFDNTKMNRVKNGTHKLAFAMENLWAHVRR